MQRDDVISALHANPDLEFEWSECSSVLQYNYSDMDVYMEPIYLQLLELQPDIKLLVYSGDDDAVCATIGTQYWIYGLGLTVTKSWTPWYFEEEVGGYIVHFNGLTFMTVHSAGHMVPDTQPERALYIWSNFLKGTLPYYDSLGEDTDDKRLSDVFAPSPVALPKEDTQTIMGDYATTTITSPTTTWNADITDKMLSPPEARPPAPSTVTPQQKLKAHRHARALSARVSRKTPATKESRRAARKAAHAQFEAMQKAKTAARLLKDQAAATPGTQ